MESTGERLRNKENEQEAVLAQFDVLSPQFRERLRNTKHFCKGNRSLGQNFNMDASKLEAVVLPTRLQRWIIGSWYI
jgi:hypothetical protein